MSSGHSRNSTVTGSYRPSRPVLAVLLVVSMLASAVPLFALPVSSDPWYADDGDMTRNIQWNFTNPSDYSLANATVAGDLGRLELRNITVGENTTADYQQGVGMNVDLLTVPDAMAIEDISLPVQTLMLQPGPEGKDTYIDEWFPTYTPSDNEDLVISGQYDPSLISNKRARIIMEFNLSLIPAGATIWNATLQLYEAPSKAAPLDYTIRSVNASWVESYPGVSWNKRDSAHSWSLVGGDYSVEVFASGTIDGTAGFHGFDITRLVDLWVRGSIPNYGLLMVAEDTLIDNTKNFEGCECAKVNQRPMLYINYTTGSKSATYQSRALGEGLNSTFTIASWGEGLLSAASDEFSDATLSPKWSWLSDPTASGGLVDLSTPGWLNITGSRSCNLSAGANYLYQDITGDFRFDTSLAVQFATQQMGAGLMVRFDDQKWLALYKAGTLAAGAVIAESRSGASMTISSVAWTNASVHLRMERVGSTYTMLYSADGSSWSTIRTFTPAFDFTRRVSVGLCLFSTDAFYRPMARFDYARIEPLGQPLLLDMRVRTGNSTLLSDPSWTAWSGALSPSDGTVVGGDARYIQYSVGLNTSYDWISPAFSGFECHLERYAETGTIVTGDVSPPALASWQTLTVSQAAGNGIVEYSYSTDHGSSWVNLGSGSVFSIPLATPSLMIEISLTTYDTLSTPSVYDVNLQYSITHYAFYVSCPATAIAGQDFTVTIDAKDNNNITQPWSGSVTLAARDASGANNASASPSVSDDILPGSGHLVISNERYDVAETIRILVSGGGAIGLSNTITVLPGPTDHIHMDPNITRLDEGSSSVFTAVGHDLFENTVTGPVTWHSDPSLGSLNRTTGTSVLLTTPAYSSGGYLNVTIQGLTLSRYIDVAPALLPPTIDPVLPTQTKNEDFGAWTLDLSPYVSDHEDSLSQLKWYTLNESVVAVSGENRTGNMVITFTTILNLNGRAELEVRVVDSDRMTASASLTVNITPVNDLPWIDAIDPLVVRYDNPYEYNLEFYVHDVETPIRNLTISVDSASAPYVHVEGLWLTITYPLSMNGTQQTVLVSVTDEDNAHSETVILVTISDDFVPRTKGSLPNLQMFQGDVVTSYFDLDDYFTDPDGDMIIYTYGYTHVSVVIQANKTVDFYAPSSWYGVEYVVFRANDSSGARAESAMLVEVIAVNRPPTIAGVPDIIVKFGREFSFDLSPYVSDLGDEGETLTVSTNDPHVWAEGLQLTILYPSGMVGTTVPVQLIVSDGSLTDSWTMNITISTDTPPTIVISPPDFSFDEDEPEPYPAAGHINDFFSDEDGDPLTYFAFVSTDNMTVTVELDNGNWTVVFNPEKDWNGLTHLTLRAVDGAGALVETTVQLIVNSVADRPILSLPESFSVTTGAHTLLDITNDIADPDSVLADFRFVVAPEYADYVTVHNGIILFEFPDDYLGEDEESRDISISITVFDQDNLFSTDTITVTLSRPAVPSSSNPILWLALLGSAAAASIFFVFAVIRRKKPFVVHDMMLIHNDGFLISRQATPVAGEIDEQILSGMLTAVLNFVEDSMAKNKESLTTFGFKEYEVMVKRGEKMFAAVVFDGDPPAGIEASMDEFIKKFERIYRNKLVDWTGDIDTDFAGVNVLINAWVRDNSKKAKRSTNMPWKNDEQAHSVDQTAK